MPNVLDHEILDAVLGTEHELIHESKNKWYSGWIDLFEMALGDTVEIKTTLKLSPTSTMRRYKLKTYRNEQENPLMLLPAVPSDVEIIISLKQTEGVAKDFEWKVFAD